MHKYITNQIIKSKSKVIEINKNVFADSTIVLPEEDILKVLDSGENINAFFCNFIEPMDKSVDINSFSSPMDSSLIKRANHLIIGIIANSSLKMKTVGNLMSFFIKLKEDDESDIRFMAKTQKMIGNEVVVFLIAVEYI